MAILVTCEACKAKLRVRDEYQGKEVWCPACKAPLTLTGERVPNHEVFISYSNKDKAVADALCATLEAKSLRCWVAPRDIAAGNSWGGSIIEAIEDAQVMVLVYSSHSNLSPQIIREVERAVAKGLLIVPFRIEAAPMSKDMEYFLSASHWFDALTPPLEIHLAHFAEMVRLILFKKAKDAAPGAAHAVTANPHANLVARFGAAVGVMGVVLALGAFLWVRQQQNKDVVTTAPANHSSTSPSLSVARSQELLGPGTVAATTHTNAPASTATQPQLVVPPPHPLEMPVAATVPVAKIEGAAITISCSETVRILPLTVGQPTLYDSMGGKLINNISPELSGWQFVSVPWHTINSYEIRINQDGIIYAFGGGNDQRRTIQKWIGAEEAGKWEDAPSAISGPGGSFNFCLRRKVIADEIIKLKGLELQFAAKSIELAHDGKAEAATQPAAPVPVAAAVAPVAVTAPAAQMKGSAITVCCSEEVRVRPLEAGQPRKYDSEQWFINGISPELSGWQFVCIPQHTIISYEIRVNQNGVLYAFGGGRKNDDERTWLGSEEYGKWEAVHSALKASIKFCFRRKVSAGEIIKLKGSEMQLAAKSIELARDGKVESAVQQAAPTPAPAVNAPQSAVQAGQPWTNSLGMIFVPVPGTAVQFSIWDTRVQDYEVYVATTGHTNESKNPPPFEQGPTHPVAFIGWKGSKAFCAWLTEKERREGTINAEQFYRLPTDLEWSTAVGLRNEPGDTAAERNGKVRDVYPWGTTWPPPLGAGNYGVRLHADDFDKTSPVGSFAPNQFGLYDMGGNVHQWCDEVEDGMHIMRGGSWKTGRQEEALLSHRWFWPGATFRDPGFGFRCVLAGGSVPSPR